METQEVAIGIMDDLHAQRDTIQRSRGRVRCVNVTSSKGEMTREDRKWKGREIEGMRPTTRYTNREVMSERK